MFGNNPKRKVNVFQDGINRRLAVKKVFATIQGEGPFAGCAAIFVRMFGCNLQCWFCDTDFEGEHMLLSVRELTDLVRETWQWQDDQIAMPLVVFTGGEPLRQELAPAITALLADGYAVQVETAGVAITPRTLEVARKLDPRITWVVSPKTKNVHKVWSELPASAVHWKYIVGLPDAVDAADGLPNVRTQGKASNEKRERIARPTNGGQVWIQPLDVSGLWSESDKALAPVWAHQQQLEIYDNCVAVAKRHPHYRISMQTHKILEVE